jgi:hypothetical protein
MEVPPPQSEVEEHPIKLIETWTSKVEASMRKIKR